MLVFELIFEHLDRGVSQGTVTEDLVFEYTPKDFDDVDKIAEITDFELWLSGKRFETAQREGQDCFVYLSDKDKDGLHCYCVKYGVETTQIFEIKPSIGELTE